MVTTETRQRWIWKLETGGNVDVPWTTAREAYRQVWPDAKIHEVRDVPAVVDVSGNDLLVETKAGHVHVAQRYRKPFDGGVEVTLCSHNPDGSPAEYNQIRRAHDPHSPVSGPSLYALGVARDRAEPGRHGFAALYLLHLAPVVSDLMGTDRERGNDGEPFKAHTGRRFWAYPWAALREVDAVYRSWDIEDLQPREVDPLEWGTEGAGIESSPIKQSPTYTTRGL